MLSTSARLVGIPLILVAAFISTSPGVSDGLRAERASVYSSIRSFIMSKWSSKSTLDACDHQKYQILDIARLLFHKSHGSTGIEGACVAFYGLLSRLRLRFLSRKGKFNSRRRMKILHRNDLYSMKTHENIYENPTLDAIWVPRTWTQTGSKCTFPCGRWLAKATWFRWKVYATCSQQSGTTICVALSRGKASICATRCSRGMLRCS